MSNQEPQNQNKTAEEAGVEKRRRFIKGAGVATPVILTLSSPSVFGALCLSEIMSGNESHTGNGSCALGHTPAWWRNPTNKGAWSQTPYTYSTLGAGTDCGGYTLGTLFSAAFLGALPENVLLLTMLSNMCEAGNSLDSYLVAALLNASTPGSNYLYTPDQVIQLKKKQLGVPPNNSKVEADVLAFLQTTMQ